MPNTGIQMLTSIAINQGFCDARKPVIDAATNTISTIIPVSSQFGRESIQATAMPETAANKHQIRNDA